MGSDTLISEPTGPRFGPYILTAVLGRGGMGVIYRAYDTVKARTVALKVLIPELATDKTFQDGFRRELRRAARLSEPHIIPIHDFGQIDGRLYIDMRLVEGIDLAALLARDGPMPPPAAAWIIAQVASALDAAHAAGLIHRDVKPSNVLITGHGQSMPFAYLIDFGIARTTNTATLSTGIGTIGTLAYMAPERIEGSPSDARADVYSLACVLYECLTGRTPFTGETADLMWAQVNMPPPVPSAVRPGVSAAVDEVIARGMAKDPANRYRTAGELAEAILTATAEHGVTNIPGDDSRTLTAAATTGQAGGRGRAEAIPRHPLHFIILADCSSKMKGEKIQALNYVIADMMPHLAAWEQDHEQAQVFVRAIAFATEPWWHIADPQPVAGVRWKPLQSVPGGLTNMGPAFAMAAEALAPGRIERRALRPALLLITDGLATDPPGGFESGLAALLAQPAGNAALRLTIAIGRDAQPKALNRFIGDPSVPIFVANNAEDIVDRLEATSLAGS